MGQLHKYGDITPFEFKTDGFSARDLINKEIFTLPQLKNTFTVDELFDKGFTVEELFRDGGYKFSEIETIYNKYKNTILKDKTKLTQLEELFKKCKKWYGRMDSDCTYKTESQTGGRYSNKKSRRIIRNKQ